MLRQRSSFLGQAFEPRNAVQPSGSHQFEAEGFGENVALVHVRYAPKIVVVTDVGSRSMAR